MKPGFLWICDLQLVFVRCKKVWHLSAALPQLGAGSLMPTKEWAYAVALLAKGAAHRPIFMKLPGMSCLSARCPSKLRNNCQELQHLLGATGGWKNWHKINKTLQDNIIFCLKVRCLPNSVFILKFSSFDIDVFCIFVKKIAKPWSAVLVCKSKKVPGMQWKLA